MYVYITNLYISGLLLSFSLRKSKYHNLLSWLLGVYLVYVTPDRQKEKENRKLDTIRSKTKVLSFMLPNNLFC